MSKKNPEYDFKWCPGCGDFGVRRAIEFAMIDRLEETGLPMENNVVVAGIGCSGNLVHLLEGAQPYGFHGIHGRSQPIAMGVKMASPGLNVLVVMDNGVYGLTKGQSSPTTKLGEITSSTPYGKMEAEADPLELYLTMGVSFIAAGFSGQPRQLAKLINQGMNHQGFSMVHVQSPCTTYNDTFEMLKGNPKKGIDPLIWDVPEDHDRSDKGAAYSLLQERGLPVGVIYEDGARPSLDARLKEMQGRARQRTTEEILASYEF